MPWHTMLTQTQAGTAPLCECRHRRHCCPVCLPLARLWKATSASCWHRRVALEVICMPLICVGSAANQKTDLEAALIAWPLVSFITDSRRPLSCSAPRKWGRKGGKGKLKLLVWWWSAPCCLRLEALILPESHFLCFFFDSESPDNKKKSKKSEIRCQWLVVSVTSPLDSHIMICIKYFTWYYIPIHVFAFILEMGAINSLPSWHSAPPSGQCMTSS